jgi:uncharacterized membrane protein YecN with MAPEG domain
MVAATEPPSVRLDSRSPGALLIEHVIEHATSGADFMTIGLACTALLGLLLFGLGLYVSILRQRYRQIIGHDTGPTDPVYRAVRAHANTAEYVPFLAVLFLWFAMRPAPTWIAVTIVIATMSRFLLVIGLLWGGPLDKPNPARFLGALLTYLCGLALVAGLVVS